MKTTTKRQTLHVINATHWDREWLLSFVGYRHRLLHHNDRPIELMERDPAFRHYQMDGQSICMEDYLRVRPEMTARLRKLVRAGHNGARWGQGFFRYDEERNRLDRRADDTPQLG